MPAQNTILRKVKNSSGAAIEADVIVALDGPETSGSDLYNVIPADPSVGSSMPAVGITVAKINNGVVGVIAVGGWLRSSLGLSQVAPGQSVYVGPGGAPVTTAPSGIVQEIAVYRSPYFEITIDIDEVGDKAAPQN